MSDRDKTNTRLEKHFTAALSDFQMIRPGDRLIAGLSGGADSICMAHLLFRYCAEHHVDLAFCHINHQLRGDESLRDEQFCRDFAEKSGVPIYIRSVKVTEFAGDKGLSLEEAARTLRYQAFREILEETGFNTAATAHHLDDLAGKARGRQSKRELAEGQSGPARENGGNDLAIAHAQPGHRPRRSGRPRASRRSARTRSPSRFRCASGISARRSTPERSSPPCPRGPSPGAGTARARPRRRSSRASR